LLVALATATVLAAAAGARRGQTAFDRLWASTLPATVTALPNQPGFDWAKVRALPEVAVLSEFPVNGTPFELTCCPDASVGFAPTGDEMARTIERPVLQAGRVFDPGRADEILVTPQFVAAYHKGVGDLVTMRLASPKQVDEQWDGTTGPPLGPVVQARIVGVGRNVFGSSTTDGPESKGGVLALSLAAARALLAAPKGQLGRVTASCWCHLSAVRSCRPPRLSARRRQRLYEPTFGDRAIAALADEIPELAAKRGEIADLPLDLGEMPTINAYAGRVPVISMIPEIVTAGSDTALLGIGVSFESNAQLAALYGIEILSGKSKVGDLKVGVVSPPDIAISFLKARQIGRRVPFHFFEGATIVYDAKGNAVRTPVRAAEAQK